MPIPLREIAVVSNSFHVKPLLPLLRKHERYHVLALTQNEVTLWDGNTERIAPLGTKDVPGSKKEALGEEINTSVQSLSHHGPGPGGAVHGSGTPADQGKDELRRFFREVDKRVEDRHSKPTGRPLILAAVDYYHPLFREVSKNPRLLDKGIVHDPKSMSADELRLAALEIVGPLREEGIAEALDEYGRARAHAQGSDDVHAVGSAAAAGRVKHLFLEEARRIWGRVDRISPEAPVPVVDWPRPSGSERARPSATGDGTRPGPASSARAAPVR